MRKVSPSIAACSTRTRATPSASGTWRSGWRAWATSSFSGRPRGRACRLCGVSWPRRALAASDPGNTAWQRDVSVSLNRIGDADLAAGDRPERYRATRKLSPSADAWRRSIQDNATWQRDVSVGLSNVGIVKLVLADNAGALAAYQESLGIRRALADADKANTDMRRDDRSVALDDVGDAQVEVRRQRGALAAYRGKSRHQASLGGNRSDQHGMAARSHRQPDQGRRREARASDDAAARVGVLRGSARRVAPLGRNRSGQRAMANRSRPRLYKTRAGSRPANERRAPLTRRSAPHAPRTIEGKLSAECRRPGKTRSLLASAARPAAQ